MCYDVEIEVSACVLGSRYAYAYAYADMVQSVVQQLLQPMIIIK